MMYFDIFHGDYADKIKTVGDESVNLILTDMPYGLTAAKWDKEINLADMWREFIRVIKDEGAIVCFGQEPFSTKLRMSNIGMYRYDYVWIKQKPSNFQLMNFQPGRVTEQIIVFSKSKACYVKNGRVMKYRPQMERRETERTSNVKIYGNANLLHDYETKDNIKTYIEKHPTNILRFNTVTRGKTHPTQKPVDLLSYLIKTYTDTGDIVMDPFMGTGSTGVAAMSCGRSFIGCEIDEPYFDEARERISFAYSENEPDAPVQ